MISTNPGLSVNVAIVNAQLPADSGMVNLTPLGGTGPYQYTIIDNGQTYNNAIGQFSGLDSGAIQISVTDSKTCTFTKDTIISNIVPFAVKVVHTNVTCFGGRTVRFRCLWKILQQLVRNIFQLTAGKH